MPRAASLALALLTIAAAFAGCASETGAPDDAGPSGPPPAGDYGDAPDGGPTGYPAPFAQTGDFPTLHASDGARTKDLTKAFLGAAASNETDANDAADADGAPNLVNRDADDGLVGLTMLLTGIPPPAVLTVRASAPASGGGDLFLNVLLDLDMDGDWGGVATGAPEWVVKNHAVTIAAGEEADVETPAFAFANGLLLPDGAWMRVALTSERVSASDWTGTGEFSAGEVEDHVVRIPEVEDKKPAIPVMDCPDEVDFGGAATALVTCTITNVAPVGHGSDISWSLTRASGGVTIDTTSGTTTIAPGASAPVTFTGTRGDPLPSTWRYSAVGIDPPSVVTEGGVDVGYGTSDGALDFIDALIECVLFIDAITGGRQHYTGESDAIWEVLVLVSGSEEPASGATVTGTTNTGQTVSATTDAQGRAELRQRVYSYGDYPLTVTGVTKEGCEYDASSSQTSGTAAVT